MKIKHLKRYFIGIAMVAFLGLLVGNAFADKDVKAYASRDFNDGTNGAFSNNYMVASPYWQVEGGASYTFVAVTHSSLSGMASQIGLVINATTSAGAAYDTAASFTVSAGSTQRVFIIPTNHATINSTSIPAATFIAGTSNFTYGHLRITPQTSHPMQNTEALMGAGKLVNRGEGFRDSTMLSYWGSVIVEANTTGFAMEFIGDMNDSQTFQAHNIFLMHNDGSTGTGGGYMSTGPNLN